MVRVREYDSDRSSEAADSPRSSVPRSPSEPRSPADSPPRSLSPARNADEAIVVGLPARSGGDSRAAKRSKKEDRKERRADDDDDRERERERERDRRREEDRERRREKERERKEKDRARREERKKKDEEKRKREEEKRAERKKKEEERRQRELERKKKEEEERKEKARLLKEAAAARKAAENVASSRFIKIENIDRCVTAKHIRSIFAILDCAVVSVQRASVPVVKFAGKKKKIAGGDPVAAAAAMVESSDDDDSALPTTVPLDEVLVEFDAEATADAAVHHFNNGFINGRRVKARLARDPKDPALAGILGAAPVPVVVATALEGEASGNVAAT